MLNKCIMYNIIIFQNEKSTAEMKKILRFIRIMPLLPQWYMVKAYV